MSCTVWVGLGAVGGYGLMSRSIIIAIASRF